MWHVENMLADLDGRQVDGERATLYADGAAQRARFFVQYLFNSEKGWFMDYNYIKNAQTPILSLAGMYPLFYKLATPQQATAFASTLRKTFQRPCGRLTPPPNTAPP